MPKRTAIFSSPSKQFQKNVDPDYLDVETALELATGEANSSTPVITTEEFLALTRGHPEVLIRLFQQHLTTLKEQVRQGTYDQEELDDWVMSEIRKFKRLIQRLQQGG